MRAALVEHLGEPPRPAEVDEPAVRSAGRALVEVAAAPLNPVDLHVASGNFYAGVPQLPYVPGREGVGTVIEGDALTPGTRIRFLCQAGYGGDGSFAERAVVDEASAMPVIDGVSDADAASLGIAGLAAWLALDWRARLQAGEHVLVLGATGIVGRLAVQAAGLLGAARVVAAGRDAGALGRALELGADATVQLHPDEAAATLAERFREATNGRLDVVVDPLWGVAATAASAAASPGARIINIGAAAADGATLSSGAIRGKMLSILGLTVFAVPGEALATAYGSMLDHAAAGRLIVDHEVLPLGGVTEAWRRQAASPHAKLVIDPRRF